MSLTSLSVFHNSHKEIIEAIREKVPADIFVASRIPKTRPAKMVLVIDAGGNYLGGRIRAHRINVLVWGGKTWEETADLCYEVQASISSLTARPFSNIIHIEPELMPTPSPFGEDTETPVYSCSFTMSVASQA